MSYHKRNQAWSFDVASREQKDHDILFYNPDIFIFKIPYLCLDQCLILIWNGLEAASNI